MNEIALSDALIEEMINHVAAYAPEEACGLVGGRGGRAARLYPIENIMHSSVAYEMAPRQQVRAMLDMEAAGECMVFELCAKRRLGAGRGKCFKLRISARGSGRTRVVPRA